MSILLAVLLLAGGTYVYRIVGPLLEGRVTLPAAVEGLLSDAAIVLLTALTAITALTQGQEFAGWARPAGVAVAALLAVLKAPFPVIVIAAAACTALLRLFGID